MAINFEISHSDALIKVHVTGNLNEDDVRQLWAAIVEACTSFDCYDILGISDLDRPFSTEDAYNHHQIFTDVGVTRRHRIAWVNRDPESRNILKFTESVLLNRSKLTGGLFASVDEAKQWLNEAKK